MSLFIRTQASNQIGMGHFMRCFALAEAGRAENVAVTFVMDEAVEAVRSRCDAIGAGLVTTGATVASDGDVMAMVSLGLTRSDWLVIDSYAADAAYTSLQRKTARVAVLDDLGLLESYDCDLLINPAMAAPDMAYSGRTSGRCLLGAAYALIRQEFRRDPGKSEGHITVMFGGADPTGLTERAVRLIRGEDPESEIRVVAGPANTHTLSLKRLSEQIQNIRIFDNPPSVADVLEGSRLVITAAGGSVGEVAAMALPALVLVVYDNQMAALTACPYPALDCRTGLPHDLGKTVRMLMNDSPRLTELATRAHAVVDGLGPSRILEAMGYV